MTAQDCITLSRTGDKMPLVGFAFERIPRDYVEDTVYNAIKQGHRLIDSAANFGNEDEVGRGINRAIKDGIVKREELFIVTKLCTYHNKDRVRAAFDKQLKDLDLEYVDLYLIHYPISLKFRELNNSDSPGWCDETGRVDLEPSPLHECWPELEKLVEAKLARNIGVANFNLQFLADLLTYAKVGRLGQVAAYSPFGQSKDQLLEDGINITPLIDHHDIKQIAEKYQKTTAEILVRWSTHKNAPVILKDIKPSLTTPYLELFSWSLDHTDMETFSFFEKGSLRVNDPYRYHGFPVFS